MKANAPWTKKHQPAKTGDVIKQGSSLTQLVDFVGNYKKQKKKAVIVYGASGCGKTSSIHALANELGYEVLEINASDFRDAKSLTSIVGSASKQRSLFSKGKIILVDELDGITGREDRGGAAALVKLIKSSSFPIIMTANDPWNKKFSSLRKTAKLVEYTELSYEDVYEVLKKVCKLEKIDYEENILKSLARRAGGDLRSAITDLQVLCSYSKKLSKEDVNELSARDRDESVPKALIKIFKNSDPSIALSAFDNVNEDLNKCMLWVDENLPKEYTDPKDLAAAYDSLSKADVFNGRIRRWQHWRFLVYVNALATAGVAAAKKEKNKGFVQYKQTSRLLKIYIANMKYQRRKFIAQKIAEKTHTSVKESVKNLPYIQFMFRKDKKLAAEITEEFELDNDDVAWLSKA
ncbi:MAG: replication factor C large subunit [bacterium]|nr:replication factor C large subunit [bacterium]